MVEISVKANKEEGLFIVVVFYGDELDLNGENDQIVFNLFEIEVAI